MSHVPNLPLQTLFDFHFTSPRNHRVCRRLELAKSLAASHEVVVADIALGAWKIKRVRVHAIETQHNCYEGVCSPIGHLFELCEENLGSRGTPLSSRQHY